MAYKVYGKSYVSILTLASQKSTGPGTSLKLYLGSAGLVVCTLALTNDIFVILLRTSRKNLAYLKLGNVRFLSHPFQFITI